MALADGAGRGAALLVGYRAAFLAGACFAALGAVLGATLLRPRDVAASEAAMSTH